MLTRRTRAHSGEEWNGVHTKNSGWLFRRARLLGWAGARLEKTVSRRFDFTSTNRLTQPAEKESRGESADSRSSRGAQKELDIRDRRTHETGDLGGRVFRFALQLPGEFDLGRVEDFSSLRAGI